MDIDLNVRSIRVRGDAEPDRRFKVSDLSGREALAFQLTQGGARGLFDHEDLTEAYLAVHESFDLPRADALSVTREIESHTGLLMRVGRDSHEFLHLSIQEYLTAEYLVKRGGVPYGSRTLPAFPNEYAVAVALSTDPSAYMADLVSCYFRDLSGSPGDAEGEFIEVLPPFAARLVTERPNWRRTEILGAAVALLHSVDAGRLLRARFGTPG